MIGCHFKVINPLLMSGVMESLPVERIVEIGLVLLWLVTSAVQKIRAAKAKKAAEQSPESGGSVGLPAQTSDDNAETFFDDENEEEDDYWHPITTEQPPALLDNELVALRASVEQLPGTLTTFGGAKIKNTRDSPQVSQSTARRQRLYAIRNAMVTRTLLASPRSRRLG